jgi:hypothetical protein
MLDGVLVLVEQTTRQVLDMTDRCQLNSGGVTTPPETQTEQRVDRFMLKKDRRDESYTRPIRIYVT